MPVPAASSPTALRRMQRQARRDTTPEMALRRELHRRGLRYRVDCAVIPGVRRRADLVFRRARIAVFVDGCFWHSCPLHRTQPKSNAEWWADKLAANVARDRDTNERLASEGWNVVRVWAHADMVEAAQELGAMIAMRTRDRPPQKAPLRAGSRDAVSRIT